MRHGLTSNINCRAVINRHGKIINFYMKKILYKVLISPKSSDPDGRRQEFILNIILVSILTGSICALIIAVFNSLSSSVNHYGGTYLPTLVFILFIGLILAISRRGHFRSGSLIFVGLLIVATLQLLLAWGYMLQIVVLLEVLIVVVAGILFNARWGLIVSVITGGLTITTGILHDRGVFKPDLSWQNDPYMVGDAIGFSVIFLMIGVLTWLSNREISYSLKRARVSELALKLERDNLEGKVIERTKQLEETQLARLMELQKFAEFGRVNANLLHEISNPLTSAKLHLELAGRNVSNPILQVSNNLKQMERYLMAARHQINETSITKNFSVDKEVKAIIKMMAPQVRRAKVTIASTGANRLRLRGDPVKFNQIIRNLISNSIDSYDRTTPGETTKLINVSAITAESYLIISVQDFGQGLSEAQINRIFEPFYTSKTNQGRNMGLGLAMVKRFVEQDFKGQISVTSNKTDGTIFTVSLKIV